MANLISIIKGRVIAHEKDGVRVLGVPSFDESSATGLTAARTTYCAVDDGDVTEAMAKGMLLDGQDIGLCGVHELNFGYPHRGGLHQNTGEAPASTNSRARR